jgi:hypothetical protein
VTIISATSFFFLSGCSYNWHEWKELTHHEEWSEPEHGERSPGYDNGSQGPRHELMSILEVSWAAREKSSPWLLGGEIREMDGTAREVPKPFRAAN